MVAEVYERVNQCNVYLLPLYKTFTNVCRGAWLTVLK
jgi:hypothetical protein